MVDLEIRRLGFTDLTPGRTSSLNIIFVHGLMGHPQKTWQIEVKEPSSRPLRSIFKSTPKPIPDPSTSFFWPQHLLAEDLPDARVWTYGYDADALQGIFTAKNKNSISQHGNDLNVKLGRVIQGSIIFVAHSLGGVLVKDVLWQSEFCQKNTKGILFLGTPHRGSELGGYAGLAANLAGMALQDINHKLVRSLEVDNQVLNIINREFIKTITRLRIPIHSFQEGKPISGVKGFHNKVVPDYSSVLDIDPSLETTETISHDHRQMVKCKDKSDEQYHAILGVVKQYIPRINTPSAEIGKLSAKGMPDTKSTSDMDTTVAEIMSDRTAGGRYTIPYANRQFTGRRKQIEKIEDRLISQDDFQEFAICGLGGIGKTQIALAFCHHTKTNYPEYSIFWVSALSRASFEKDYAEIARKCEIPITDRKQTLQTVQQYLESDAASPWIMIVDNADVKELMLHPEQGLKMYLPEHPKGFRIYTSRDEGLVQDITLGINTMVMEEMEYQDARALLVKYLGSNDILHDETATTELLEELEFLPLAVVQAASFMKKAYINIPQYLDLMRKTDRNRVKLLSEENRQAVRLGSSNAIIVTWLISFDRIREEEVSALKLLYFLAVVHNKDIPHSMLPQESEVDLTRAVGVLRNYSFLVKQDKGDTYDMHRLVHQAIRTWMQDSLVDDRIGEWQLAHLVDVWPSAETKNELLWQKYLPHAFAAISATTEASMELRANLFLLAGRCLRIDGRLQEAIDLLSDCYVWRTEQLDSNDEARLEAQRELAIAYRWSGREAEAIQMLSQLVQKEQSLPNLEDTTRMQTLCELGIAQLWARDFAAAVTSLKHVVDHLDPTVTGNNPERLQALHGLILAYRSNDQPEKASELLRQNPDVERKLQVDILNRIPNNSSSRRTDTLGKDLILPLDLIGKLDWLYNILQQESNIKFRYALEEVLRDTLETKQQRPQTLITHAMDSPPVNSLVDLIISKPKWQRSQKRNQTEAVQQDFTLLWATELLNSCRERAIESFAEQYFIDTRSTQSQYLSVGSEIWGIRVPKRYDLEHETLNLWVMAMDICWTNVVEIHQELCSQGLIRPLDMIHDQDFAVRVGLDCILRKLILDRDMDKGTHALFALWKICIAQEYWQQGYSEIAIEHAMAARRIAMHHRVASPSSRDCERWLKLFETERPAV